MKNLKIYASLIVLAIAFNLNSCSSSSSSPGETIKKSYDLIKSNQAEKAAAMYVSSKGEMLSKDDIKKMAELAGMATDQWNKKGGLKNVEITEETIAEDGKSAKVTIIENYNNGDTEEETGELLKIDGKWYIKL